MALTISKATSDLQRDSSKYHAGTNLLHNSVDSLLYQTPRLAKDADYAFAILTAWKADVEVRPDSSISSVAAPIVYHDENSTLFGYIYRPFNINSLNNCMKKLPAVILFHTGAGPQDIFLRWKADSIVTDTNTFPDGAVVLIADIMGDETGWGWDTDRTQYNRVAAEVLVPDENGERRVLQSRIKAALDLMTFQPEVDPKRIGVVGFCLGGHPVLELGRMRNVCVRAMVTFHGVFGSVHKMKVSSKAGESSDNEKGSCAVLICTGRDDPFVPPSDVTAAKTMFESQGYSVEVMEFEDTKHGFINPAQAYNANPAFGYNAETCALAWKAMCSLLKDSLN